MRNIEARCGAPAGAIVFLLVALLPFLCGAGCGDDGSTQPSDDSADAGSDGTTSDGGASDTGDDAGPGEDASGSTGGPGDDASTGGGADDASVPGDTVGSDDDSAVVDDNPWSQVSLGDDGVITDVFAVDATEAYAVGGRRVMRYNGVIWAAYGEPGADTLGGVWSGEGVTVVVGEDGFIARRNHTDLKWTDESFDTEYALRAIGGRNPDDLWAVGDHGVILHYAGAEAGWTLEDETNGLDLWDVFVDPEIEGVEGVTAAGSGGRLARFFGSEWSSQHVASSDVTLHAVWGRDGRMFAVGTDGTITVKDGETAPWQGQTTNLTKPRDLYGIAGSSADEVWAFGDGGSVLKWLGSSWSVQTITGPANVVVDLHAAAWAKAAPGVPGTFLVTAAEGDGLRRDDFGQWVDMDTVPSNGLTALLGDPDGTLWAVGMDGLIMARTEAQGWTSVTSPTTEDLFALTLTADGVMYAVGAAGTVLRRDADGAAELLGVASFADLFAVVVDGDQLLVGGKGGTLLRGPVETGVLTPWLLGFNGDVNHIGRGGDGALWFAGAFGQLHRSEDGETAPLVPTGVAGNLETFVPTGAGVLVGGANGVLLDVTGDGETDLLHEEPGLFVYGLHVTEEASVAVGWNGTALRLLDGTWTMEDTGVHSVLEAVWHDGTQATAVGRLGAALVRTEAP